MIRNDEQCLSIIDAFQSAAVGAQSWETAMQSFADITGSRSGQLTGRPTSILSTTLEIVSPPSDR